MPDAAFTLYGDLVLNQDSLTRAASQAQTAVSKIRMPQHDFALGRITSDVNRFNQSIESASVRVAAFGATASIYFSVVKGIKALVTESIGLEKKLTNINVILQASSGQLKNFSNSLFKIAKDTGNSIDTVSDAALEFSRQGLGMEQTLKRTRDALLLVRISGLEAGKAVQTLTTITNTYEESIFDTTRAVSQLAKVDAAYAVSAGDLADAVTRTGSAALDAKVSFEELLASVTAVRQRTGRTGAEIGNAFKTIFQRIGRPEALTQLEGIGIAVRDIKGNTLPAIEILTELAKRFNGLSDAQRSTLSQTVGGVRQLNILSALLRDLAKDTNIYSGALEAANSATDEAVRRNELLNQTLAARANRTSQAFRQVAAGAGMTVFKPVLEKVFTAGEATANVLTGQRGLTGMKDIDDMGARVGDGILRGIGSALSGPGLVMISVLLGKLAMQVGKIGFGAGSKILLGQTQERVNLENAVNVVLQQQAAAGNNLIAKHTSILGIQREVLAVIEAQTIASQRLSSVSSAVAARLSPLGVTATESGLARAPVASGFIPSLAMENESIRRGVGGVSPGTKPVLGSIRTKQGVIPFVGHRQEVKVLNWMGTGEDAILNPDQIKAFGKRNLNKYGTVQPLGTGYVPNLADYTGGIWPVTRFDQKRQLKFLITEAGKHNKVLNEFIGTPEGAAAMKQYRALFPRQGELRLGAAGGMIPNFAPQGYRLYYDALQHPDVQGMVDPRAFGVKNTPPLSQSSVHAGRERISRLLPSEREYLEKLKQIEITPENMWRASGVFHQGKFLPSNFLTGVDAGARDSTVVNYKSNYGKSEEILRLNRAFGWPHRLNPFGMESPSNLNINTVFGSQTKGGVFAPKYPDPWVNETGLGNLRIVTRPQEALALARQSMAMRLAGGRIPNFAEYGPIRGISESLIAENLRGDYHRGSHFKGFYHDFNADSKTLGSPLILSGRELGTEGQFFKKLYAQQSFDTNDAQAVMPLAKIVDSLRTGRNPKLERDILESLRSGTRRWGMFEKLLADPNLVIGGRKPYKKTSQFFESLNLNPEALAIDKNFLYSATRATNDEELYQFTKYSNSNPSSVSKRLFDQMYRITKPLARQEGLSTIGEFHSGVFAGRRARDLTGLKGVTSYEPFTEAFNFLRGGRVRGAGGIIPNLARRRTSTLDPNQLELGFNGRFQPRINPETLLAQTEAKGSSLRIVEGMLKVDFLSSLMGNPLFEISQLINQGAIRGIDGGSIIGPKVPRLVAALMQSSKLKGSGFRLKGQYTPEFLRIKAQRLMGQGQMVARDVEKMEKAMGVIHTQFPPTSYGQVAFDMTLAKGHIPNFSAFDDSINRESRSVPKSQIYSAYVDTPKYSGPVIANRRDEPTPESLLNRIMNHPDPANAGMAGGRIPNFVDTSRATLASAERFNQIMNVEVPALLAKITQLKSGYTPPGFNNKEVAKLQSQISRLTKEASAPPLTASANAKPPMGQLELPLETPPPVMRQRESSSPTGPMRSPTTLGQGRGYLAANPYTNKELAVIKHYAKAAYAKYISELPQSYRRDLIPSESILPSHPKGFTPTGSGLSSALGFTEAELSAREHQARMASSHPQFFQTTGWQAARNRVLVNENSRFKKYSPELTGSVVDLTKRYDKAGNPLFDKGFEQRQKAKAVFASGFEEKLGKINSMSSEGGLFNSLRSNRRLEALESQAKSVGADISKETAYAKQQNRMNIQQKGFQGAFAIPMITQMGVSMMGGQDTKFGRAAGGIAEGVGTGAMVATLTNFSKGGVAGGIAIGAVQSLNAIIKSLSPTFEQLQKKSQDLVAAKEQESNAIGSFLGAFSNVEQLKQSGNTSPGAMKAAMGQMDITLGTMTNPRLRGELMNAKTSDALSNVAVKHSKEKAAFQASQDLSLGLGKYAREQRGTFGMLRVQADVSQMNEISKFFGERSNAYSTLKADRKGASFYGGNLARWDLNAVSGVNSSREMTPFANNLYSSLQLSGQLKGITKEEAGGLAGKTGAMIGSLRDNNKSADEVDSQFRALASSFKLTAEQTDELINSTGSYDKALLVLLEMLPNVTQSVKDNIKVLAMEKIAREEAGKLAKDNEKMSSQQDTRMVSNIRDSGENQRGKIFRDSLLTQDAPGLRSSLVLGIQRQFGERDIADKYTAGKSKIRENAAQIIQEAQNTARFSNTWTKTAVERLGENMQGGADPLKLINELQGLADRETAGDQKNALLKLVEQAREQNRNLEQLQQDTQTQTAELTATLSVADKQISRENASRIYGGFGGQFKAPDLNPIIGGFQASTKAWGLNTIEEQRNRGAEYTRASQTGPMAAADLALKRSRENLGYGKAYSAKLLQEKELGLNINDLSPSERETITKKMGAGFLTDLEGVSGRRTDRAKETLGKSHLANIQDTLLGEAASLKKDPNWMARAQQYAQIGGDAQGHYGFTAMEAQLKRGNIQGALGTAMSMESSLQSRGANASVIGPLREFISELKAGLAQSLIAPGRAKDEVDQQFKSGKPSKDLEEAVNSLKGTDAEFQNIMNTMKSTDGILASIATKLSKFSDTASILVNKKSEIVVTINREDSRGLTDEELESLNRKLDALRTSVSALEAKGGGKTKPASAR